MLGDAHLCAASAALEPAQLFWAAPRASRRTLKLAVSDFDILNFALNLEYLEAEYYLQAAFGRNLAPTDTTGRQGPPGEVVGGRQVNFQTRDIENYAREIADDEEKHVQFLRSVLGDRAVARPKINIKQSFTAAARAAGVVGPDEQFDPYANENNFLLGAFIFEDVGVTAYKGAAPLINDRDILAAAAGILAVEAYHAGEIRTLLYSRRFFDEANKISVLRDRVDGREPDDQGIGNRNTANIVPADRNAVAFERKPRQVLNIVYLDPAAERGGFFPQGVNGRIRS